MHSFYTTTNFSHIDKKLKLETETGQIRLKDQNVFYPPTIQITNSKYNRYFKA